MRNICCDIDQSQLHMTIMLGGFWLLNNMYFWWKSVAAVKSRFLSSVDLSLGFCSRPALPQEANMSLLAGTQDRARKRSRLKLPRKWSTLTMHLSRWNSVLKLKWELSNPCRIIANNIGCWNYQFPGLYPWSRVATAAWFHIRKVPWHHNAVIIFLSKT